MICIAQPAVVQRAKKPDYSLSEGEVPLSPGDARWNALHAGRLKGNLKEKKKKGNIDFTVNTNLNYTFSIACVYCVTTAPLDSYNVHN